jgi:hypothetical protein
MARKSAYIALTGQTSPMIPRVFLNCIAYSPILSTNVRSEAEVTLEALLRPFGSSLHVYTVAAWERLRKHASAFREGVERDRVTIP